jgi:hypothetical protein
MIHSDEHFLTIQLLCFSRPAELTERFYFLEMSTLQATTLLPQDRKLLSAKILAYTKDGKYLDKQTADGFKTIGDFNNYFLNNSDYFIHDCEIEIENGLLIGSHDDGEVSVEFPADNPDQIIITSIFENNDLDIKIIDILKSKPGHYLAIDNKSNIIADFKNFDDYIMHGRN